jgi:hypothetical protein
MVLTSRDEERRYTFCVARVKTFVSPLHRRSNSQLADQYRVILQLACWTSHADGPT